MKIGGDGCDNRYYLLEQMFNIPNVILCLTKFHELKSSDVGSKGNRVVMIPIYNFIFVNFLLGLVRLGKIKLV